MTEIALYKFLYSEDAQYLCGSNPSLQFGRLKYYQLLEIVTGDARIGDVNEGKASTIIKNLEINNNTSSNILDELERSGSLKINQSAGSTVSIKNARIINEIDCFVLSLGMGDVEALADEFARNGPHAYDAALRLNSLENLLERISTSALNGGMLTDYFNIAYGPVEYTEICDKEFSTDNRFESPDPFIKNYLRYGEQREYRIALIPKSPYPDADHIRFSVPDGAPLFEAIELEGSTGKKDTSPPASTPHDFVNIVREIFEQWDSRQRVELEVRAPDLEKRAIEASEAENILFAPLRKRIVDAYWNLRGTHRSEMVDQAILYEMPPMMFNSRIAIYAGSLGHAIFPPF